MKFGKIYDFRNAKSAKKLIGKKVLVSISLYKIEKAECPTATLYEVSEHHDGSPFLVEFASGDREQHQFIREIIEDDKPLMNNRQLAEWIAKGFGEFIPSINPELRIQTYYDYYPEDENVHNLAALIRPWGSDEWVKPTVDIYERDCKIGGK